MTRIRINAISFHFGSMAPLFFMEMRSQNLSWCNSPKNHRNRQLALPTMGTYPYFALGSNLQGTECIVGRVIFFMCIVHAVIGKDLGLMSYSNSTNWQQTENRIFCINVIRCINQRLDILCGNMNVCLPIQERVQIVSDHSVIYFQPWRDCPSLLMHLQYTPQISP